MRRSADPVDGLLILDKPPGMTSNRALQTVRRLLNARKAGHTGSLDPSATGMLPLCFGEATKVCGYLLDSDKTYRVVAKLGSATDTGDADGQETQVAEVPELDESRWDEILQSFKGESSQIPPMYSALKQNGKRLYEMARQGETVEREARPIRIDDIVLLEAAANRLVFRVSCSKGTYIRTLVEDIASKAGTVAHTQRLHRESVGHFASEAMLDLKTVESLAEADREQLRAKLLPADVALTGFPEVHVAEADADKFCGGQQVGALSAVDQGLARVYADNRGFLGVGEVGPDRAVSPKRVFLSSEKTP